MSVSKGGKVGGGGHFRHWGTVEIKARRRDSTGTTRRAGI